MAKRRTRGKQIRPNVEIMQRVSQVYQLLVSGTTRYQILQFASEKWKIGERATDTYIARAKKQLIEDCEAFKENALSKAIAARNRQLQRSEKAHQKLAEDLYDENGKLIRVGDPLGGLSHILAALQDRERLLGLYAPDKLAVTGTPTIGDLWDLVNKGTEDDEANTGKQPEDPDQD